MYNIFLTTAELAQKLHYNARYVCNYLVDSVLLEGIHYVRPFGRRKILFIWEAIERDMYTTPKIDMPAMSVGFPPESRSDSSGIRINGYFSKCIDILYSLNKFHGLFK
jgi:hypothetical protein